MAKNSFRLKHHDNFTFEGDNGTYTIPSMDELKYDDWKDVAVLSRNDIRKTLEAYRAFFLRVCPDLKNEKIADNQWIQLGTAYFRAMGE